MADRKRDDNGLFVEAATSDAVREAVRTGPEPASTTLDVAEALDISRESARRKLTDLHERGRIKRREVGARAVIWWVSE